jgi:archaellum component FlaC
MTKNTASKAASDSKTIKPIDDIKNTLHSINRNINQLKIEVICIKSELLLMKEYINKLEKKDEDKNDEANGWWFY